MQQYISIVKSYEQELINKLTPTEYRVDQTLRYHIDYTSGKVYNGLTKQGISNFCGLSKNTVSKALKKLEKLKIIKVKTYYGSSRFQNGKSVFNYHKDNYIYLRYEGGFFQ